MERREGTLVGDGDAWIGDGRARIGDGGALVGSTLVGFRGTLVILSDTLFIIGCSLHGVDPLCFLIINVNESEVWSVSVNYFGTVACCTICEG